MWLTHLHECLDIAFLRLAVIAAGSVPDMFVADVCCMQLPLDEDEL